MKKNIYIYGCGNLTRTYISQIPDTMLINGIVDTDSSKWGTTSVVHNGRHLICTGDELINEDYVIVSIEDPHEVLRVTIQLENRGIEWCHIFKVVDEAFLLSGKYTAEKKEPGKMVKFIDAMLPTAKCNMKCDYCYLSHLNVDLDRVTDYYHDPKYIRYALSQERWGGSVFINLCGVGETLLCENIIEIVEELLDEGHYVQIVTNATPSNTIDKIVNSNIDSSRLFFKCSLHYEELKRLNLLDKFALNIRKLEKWGASYCVEYVPIDSSVQLIPEIKEYCMKWFDAFPHVTVTRDERFKDYRILTDYSIDDYRSVWGSFKSGMFNFKINNMDPQKYGKCLAGVLSVELNLATGELYQCTGNPRLCNIYQDQDLIFEEIGENCCLPYCFNNHAYLTLGVMPSVVTPTYLEMRDRIKSDGSHWIGKTMRNIFSQKLYDNQAESYR